MQVERSSRQFNLPKGVFRTGDLNLKFEVTKLHKIIKEDECRLKSIASQDRLWALQHEEVGKLWGTGTSRRRPRNVVSWKPNEGSVSKMDTSAVTDAATCNTEDNHWKSAMHLAKWKSSLTMPVGWVQDRLGGEHSANYTMTDSSNVAQWLKGSGAKEGSCTYNIAYLRPPRELYLEFSIIPWHRWNQGIDVLITFFKYRLYFLERH